MSIYFWIVAGVFFLAIIAVPNKLRFLINQAFATLVIPFRELSRLCLDYIENISDRCKRVLQSGGISGPPYSQKFFGTIFIFVVTSVSIVADLTLIIITLQALNLESEGGKEVVLLGFSPATLMGIMLFAGAAMQGLILLDYYAPGTLPDSLASHRKLLKWIKNISILLLAGAVLAVGILGYYRADAVSQSDKEIEEELKKKDNPKEIEAEIDELRRTTQVFLYVFLAVLALHNGILGVFAFPAFLMLPVCGFLYLMVIPAGFLRFISYAIDCLISLGYRIFVAVLGVLTGLTKPLNKITEKWDIFDNTIEGEETPPRSDPPIERETSEMESSGAKGDSRGQNNDGAEEDVEMLMNEIRESDDILDPYSERE